MPLPAILQVAVFLLLRKTRNFYKPDAPFWAVCNVNKATARTDAA
jgi:hypothetical protein